MKPQTATFTAVSLLLAASAVCVSVRHAADARNAGASGNPDDLQTTIAAVEGPAGETSRDRPGGGKADAGTLAKQLRSVLATANRADRYRALLKRAERFEAADWPLALEALSSMGMVVGGGEHALLLSAWTDSDPAAAMAWAESQEAGSLVVMSAWIGKDPDAALAYLQSPDRNHDVRWCLLTARAMGAFGEDLPRLTKLLTALPEKSRTMILQQGGPRLDGINPETRRAWIDSLEPSLRKPLLMTMLRNLPGVEAKLALAQAHPDDLGPETYGSIYSAWAKEDREDAVAALEEIEPGPMLRSAVCGTIFGLFESSHLAEAIELMKRYPDEMTDGFLGDMTIYSSDDKAELLLEVVPLIKNASLQVIRYREILSNWATKEPAAVRRWLGEHEVPHQVRKEFEGR